MKNLFILVGVVVLTILAVYFFVDRSRDDAPMDSDIVIRGRETDPRAESLTGKTTPPVKIEVSDPVTRPTTNETVVDVRATGSLSVRAALPSGELPSRYDVQVARLGPQGPEVATAPKGRFDGEATIYEELEPGRYMVTVWGEDLVGLVKNGVEVLADRMTEVVCTLEAGIKPRGRVRTVHERLPVGDAIVDFVGYERCVTGADGGFECARVLPRAALALITVTAPGFDVQHCRQLTITDPRDLDLPIGGHGCEVAFRIENDSGRPTPKNFRIRLEMNPAAWEVRRDERFTSEGQEHPVFRMPNLYAAEYRAEISFPDGEFPTRLIPFTTTQDAPALDLIVRLEAGVLMRGRLVGPEDSIVSIGVELRDERDNVIAAVTTDREGRWTIDGMRPGRYLCFLTAGRMRRQIDGAVDVPETSPFDLQLDALRRTVIN